MRDCPWNFFFRKRRCLFAIDGANIPKTSYIDVAWSYEHLPGKSSHVLSSSYRYDAIGQENYTLHDYCRALISMIKRRDLCWIIIVCMLCLLVLRPSSQSWQNLMTDKIGRQGLIQIQQHAQQRRHTGTTVLASQKPISEYLSQSSLRTVNVQDVEVFHARNACFHKHTGGMYVGNVDYVKAQMGNETERTQSHFWGTGCNDILPGYPASPFCLLPHQPISNEQYSVIKETTYLSECHYVPEDNTNPGHFLMKVSVMLGVASMWNSLKLPPIQLMSFLHCCSLDKVRWPLGELLLGIAKSNLWSDVPVAFLSESQTSIICFDNVYFDTNYFQWFPTRQMYLQWRHAATQAFPSILPPSWAPFGDESKFNQPSRRIAIFQRSCCASLRRFTNIHEVVELAQMYSTAPVQIITIDNDDDLQAQMRSLARVDVLITPIGSHLVNMIFASHKFRIIEIHSSRFHSTEFQHNAEIMGMAGYLTSDDHRAIAVDGHGICHFEQEALDKSHNNSSCTGIFEAEGCISRLETMHCDIEVDIPRLKSVIDIMMVDAYS